VLAFFLSLFFFFFFFSFPIFLNPQESGRTTSVLTSSLFSDGVPTRTWAFRALIVTGVAQLFSSALWFWGALMSNVFNPTGSADGNVGSTNIPKGMVICVPIAVLLWTVGVALFFGLPDYYRQSPETIPGFYLSLFRRRMIPWFFAMVAIQNFWLSSTYSRSWSFLFSSQHVPSWSIFCIVVFFFIGLWSGIMAGFAAFANSHPWLLPMFALGLGAPRWAQMLWGTTGIGMYLPWVGGPVASAIVSRCLWIWLGVLDTVQGVGLGMMLIATLTRQHVMAVLVGSQVIGGAATMIARVGAPNAFPDFTQGLMPGLGNPWFWICLIMQLMIPLGFFKFFRKEQVMKP
jgi:alpha-1,3-glucan synthase